MTVIVLIELTCDQCGRTDEHRHIDATAHSGEQFVDHWFDVWAVDQEGHALCPECFAEHARLARRAERSARDKARHRGDLRPLGNVVRVLRCTPNTGTPNSPLQAPRTVETPTDIG